MSKLRNTLQFVFNNGYNASEGKTIHPKEKTFTIEQAEQQIKDLMLELIGNNEDELPELDNPSIPYTARKYESRGCNKTKKDLRKKVEQL